MKTLLAVCAMVWVFSALTNSADAAQVTLISRWVKPEEDASDHAWERKNIALSTEIDYVMERELEKSDVKASCTFWSVKFSFPPLGSYDDRYGDRLLDMYVGLGIAPLLEYEGIALGNKIEFDLTSQVFWTAGLSFATTLAAPEFIPPDTGRDTLFGRLRTPKRGLPIQLGVSAQYRQLVNIDDDSDVELGGVSQTQGETKLSWREWEVALVGAWEFEGFLPYAGVKYSEVSADMKVVIPGTIHDLGSMGAENNFGVFAGVSIMSSKNMSIDIEAHFMDEEAISVAFTYRF